MEERYVILTLLGVLAWSSFLLMAMGLPSLTTFMPFARAEVRQEPMGPETLPLFFMTATSWLGAGMILFSATILYSYRWEVEHICLIGCIQALFPFLAPFLPLFYVSILRIPKRARGYAKL